VVRIDTEKNLLFIKGQIPGATDSLVEIKKM
jgi:ribosomal protein L3